MGRVDVIERRKHARYPVRIFSKVLLKKDKAENGREGVITDLSISGAKLEIADEYLIGDILIILFNYNNNDSFKLKVALLQFEWIERV